MANIRFTREPDKPHGGYDTSNFPSGRYLFQALISTHLFLFLAPLRAPQRPR